MLQYLVVLSVKDIARQIKKDKTLLFDRLNTYERLNCLERQFLLPRGLLFNILHQSVLDGRCPYDTDPTFTCACQHCNNTLSA